MRYCGCCPSLRRAVRLTPEPSLTLFIISILLSSQAQLENARLCLQDTKEAADADYEHEYQTASQALQAAVQSYVDFLELVGTIQDAQLRQEWDVKRTEIFEKLQAQLKDMKTCVRTP